MTREEKKQQRHDAIVTHGLNLIRQHGFDEVSIKQITEAAGLAKGTFFNYFASKGDLIAFWYDSIVEQAINLSINEIHPTLSEHILNVSLYCLNAARSEPQLWDAKRKLVASNTALQEAECRMDRELKAFIANTLEQTATEVNSQQLAELLVCILTGTVQECATYAQHHDVEATIRDRVKNLLRLAGA
ncbi:MAG: TetR/AcrR family transcriptional regulator [Gammaproteobacteria bacterium]|nr:TetR/AcrR family transcriptional regulator [Gammaproteobacteria bacterium]NVK87832.1 TetR/AcrR family transcriptional regulator [Gammaproteobacteria bacterium]